MPGGIEYKRPTESLAAKLEEARQQAIDSDANASDPQYQKMLAEANRFMSMGNSTCIDGRCLTYVDYMLTVLFAVSSLRRSRPYVLVLPRVCRRGSQGPASVRSAGRVGPHCRVLRRSDERWDKIDQKRAILSCCVAFKRDVDDGSGAGVRRMFEGMVKKVQ